MRTLWTLLVVCIPVAAASACGNPALMLVCSPDENVRKGAVAELRERGPGGLESLLEVRAGFVERRDAAVNDPEQWKQSNEQVQRLDEAIDLVGGQRYCSASRLYWYTDLEKAKAEADRSGKPILSLRMLGLLTDEYSCANSRFFRTTLYANEEISRVLREKFVLHWQSVRPVPKITIDFGDGRKLERTVTGNSAHYALSPDGRALDVLPGLYGPAEFAEWLGRVEHLSKSYCEACNRSRDTLVRSYHAQRLSQIEENWKLDLTAAGADASRTPDQVTNEETWRQIAALHGDRATLDGASIELIRAQNPNAAQAGRRALTKARVEDPILRLVSNLQDSIALDTVRNEYQLHRRIHERLANNPDFAADVNALNEWVYAELFLTPSSDPWLGLMPVSTYTALPNNGVVEKGAE